MKSDLTGHEDDPDKFGSFIIRRGPGIDKAVVWDALPEEIGDLDAAPDVYVIEWRPPGSLPGNGEEIVVTLKELSEKVVPKGMKLDDLLEAARSLRGRRPGSTSGR